MESKFSSFDVTLSNYNGELWPDGLQTSLSVIEAVVPLWLFTANNTIWQMGRI